MSIIQSFPYPMPRESQKEILQFLEDNFEKFDVFVIVAPTASGKTSLSKCIMDWHYGTSYIAPTNILVDQFLSEFPNTERLHRLDAYWCDEWQQSCAQTRARRKGFCSGCTCSGDLAQAKYRKGSGVYNYHTYLAHKIERGALIIDEAHNTVHTIQDRLAETIWHHDYQYPFSGDNAGLLRWIEKQPARVQKHKKITHLKEALEAEAPEYVISRTSDTFNGKGTQKGKPEERDCIKLYPVDVADKASMMWGPTVEKIILMSATIGPKDVEALGLQQRRVVYLQAASPIPPENRPIQFVPVVSLNHENLRGNIPRIAEEIENIAAYHSKEKGIVHATYELSELLRKHLTGARYIFHDRNNKSEQYERFRNSPTSDSRILVACGMYEGIDLPEDLGRWQIIPRTPWKSLADPAIRFKANKDQDWFRWETLKDLIQAAGRICRTPTDYGITYVLDSTAIKLIQESEHLVPAWFMDAVHAGNR